MLILELKEGEAIQISDDIVIRFNDIHKKQIKVAIEAPVDLHVVRAELLEELNYE
jgi:carbon storage regulator CsrA